MAKKPISEIVATPIRNYSTTDGSESGQRHACSSTHFNTSQNSHSFEAPSVVRSATKPSPDRQREFVTLMQRRLNGALIRCEERYPVDAPHSVIYVVVKRDAALWRQKLETAFQGYFGCEHSDPLAPVQFEILDLGTHEALQRLINLGLVTTTMRACRLLWPAQDLQASSSDLSQAERDRAATLREQANRKLKMTRLLSEGDLADEARAALLGAVLPLGRALAIEAHLPEPSELNEALLPPLAHRWKEALTPLRLFATESSAPLKPLLECLARV